MEEAVQAFQAGSQTFRNVLDQVAAALQAERESLQAERDTFAEEKHRFAEEMARVQQVLSPGDRVVLNIGGQAFTTTVATLRNAPAPSLFSAMFSGRHPLKADAAGAYFIDRDPRLFHCILNYLRDGGRDQALEPADPAVLLELRAEADFYGLTGLVEKVDAVPYRVTTVRRAARVSEQHLWEYDDAGDRDEVVFTVSTAVQLLGAGLCGGDAPFTASLMLEEVQAGPSDEQIADAIDPEELMEHFKVIRLLVKAEQTFIPTRKPVVAMHFSTAVLLQPGHAYMLGVRVKGSQHGGVNTYSGQDCLCEVVVDGVTVRFLDWESGNGTCQERGQFPEIYIRTL